MVKGPEKKIQDAAIKYAKSFGIDAIRLQFAPGVYTGWPDVLFLVHRGRPLFIEFKAFRKVPTSKQAARISYLLEAGYDVKICDNIKDAKKIIYEAIMAANYLA